MEKCMGKYSTRGIVFSGVIAALYVVLTYVAHEPCTAPDPEVATFY